MHSPEETDDCITHAKRVDFCMSSHDDNTNNGNIKSNERKLDMSVLLSKGKYHDIARAVRSHPSLFAKQDSKLKSTPLQMAVQNHCDMRVIRLLVNSFPKACQIPDRHGNIPLHNAAFDGSLECVTCLLLVYPEGIYVTNEEGALPLHYAAAGNTDAGVVSLLLDEYSRGAMVATDRSGILGTTGVVNNVGFRLPIHLSVYFNGCEEVSTLLLLANQNGGEMADQCGDHPIHLALAHRTGNPSKCDCEECYCAEAHVAPSHRSEGFLQTLIASSPSSVRLPSHEGFYPLHMACRENLSLSVIQLIGDIYPEAITLPCGDSEDFDSGEGAPFAAWGSYPFHFAIRNSRADVLKYMEEKYKDLGVDGSIWYLRDAQGRTALHHLAHADKNFLRSNITKVDKAWASVRCNYGWLPLHHTCCSQDSESAYPNFLFILELAPEAISSVAGVNAPVCYTPICLAAQFGHVDILKHIIKASRVSDIPINYEACFAFALNSEIDDSSVYFEKLDILLEAYDGPPFPLGYLMTARNFWRRKSHFSSQLKILSAIVRADPAAVRGTKNIELNPYEEWVIKTGFTSTQRSMISRVLLEAAPDLHPVALRELRWEQRKHVFLIRERSPTHDVGAILSRLPEKILKNVTKYL